MKIVTLIEDSAHENTNLQNEHGISLFIEVDDIKILFDTGSSDKFLENAKKLGVNLNSLDYVIISHGHFDHGGGFKSLIKEINPNIKLFVGTDFFKEKYNLVNKDEYEFTGNSWTKEFLKENDIKTKYVHEDMINISENVMLFSNFKRDPEFENETKDMYLKVDDDYKEDLFLDEISLGIKTDKGMVVIVGCSHPGMVNILESVKERTKTNIYGIIGGTHLVQEDDEQINSIIEYLEINDVKIIGACHCTGKQGQTMLSQQLENSFLEIKTGDILELDSSGLKISY